MTTLATPMLLVANNEVARLFIGEERPLVRNVSSQTIVGQSVTTTTPTSRLIDRKTVKLSGATNCTTMAPSAPATPV